MGEKNNDGSIEILNDTDFELSGLSAEERQSFRKKLKTSLADGSVNKDDWDSLIRFLSKKTAVVVDAKPGQLVKDFDDEFKILQSRDGVKGNDLVWESIFEDIHFEIKHLELQERIDFRNKLRSAKQDDKMIKEEWDELVQFLIDKG